MTCKPSEFIKTHARAQRKHEKQISTIKYATKTENITSKNYVKCIFFFYIFIITHQYLNNFKNASSWSSSRELFYTYVPRCLTADLSWAELGWADLGWPASVHFSRFWRQHPENNIERAILHSEQAQKFSAHPRPPGILTGTSKGGALLLLSLYFSKVLLIFCFVFLNKIW